MREKTNSFRINGKQMLAPDAGVSFSFEDLDSADTGRDESGYMHRFPVRYKVGSWGFSYSNMTEEEKNYTESLFPDSAEFSFTHPDKDDSSRLVTETCYRTKVSMSWYSARTGHWKNYKFNIIQC